MPFDGSEGNQIPLSQAVNLTTAYRKANPGKVLGVFLGASLIKTLLNQPDSQGIRFYFGLDGDAPHLVAVSADGDENDLFGEGYIIADDGRCTPPYMGTANALNS
jgi:hypothetical protein